LTTVLVIINNRNAEDWIFMAIASLFTVASSSVYLYIITVVENSVSKLAMIEMCNLNFNLSNIKELMLATDKEAILENIDNKITTEFAKLMIDHDMSSFKSEVDEINNKVKVLRKKISFRAFYSVYKLKETDKIILELDNRINFTKLEFIEPQETTSITIAEVNEENKLVVLREEAKIDRSEEFYNNSFPKIAVAITNNKKKKETKITPNIIKDASHIYVEEFDNALIDSFEEDNYNDFKFLNIPQWDEIDKKELITSMETLSMLVNELDELNRYKLGLASKEIVSNRFLKEKSTKFPVVLAVISSEIIALIFAITLIAYNLSVNNDTTKALFTVTMMTEIGLILKLAYNLILVANY
jgi:hypothetical protein